MLYLIVIKFAPSSFSLRYLSLDLRIGVIEFTANGLKSILLLNAYRLSEMGGCHWRLAATSSEGWKPTWMVSADETCSQQLSYYLCTLEGLDFYTTSQQISCSPFCTTVKPTWSLFVFFLLSISLFFLPIVCNLLFFVFLYVFPSVVFCASQCHGWVFLLLQDLRQKLRM